MPDPESAPAESPPSLLRNRVFRRLWFAGACVGVMRWLEMLAVAVYVLEITGSAFLVALMTVLRMLPLALFSAFAGAIAERLSRRAILMFGTAAMSLQSLALALLIITDTVAIWHIGASAFLGGLFWATDMPVRRTLIGEIAGPDRVGQAMSLEAVTNNATRMAGPVAGGALLAMVGLQGAYLLGMVLHASACALVALARITERPAGTAGVYSLLANVVDGVRMARRNRALTGTLAITVVYNLWAYPFTAMVPVIGREVLGLGAFSVGLIASAEGLGALTGAVLVLFVGRPEFYRRLYLFGVLLCLLMVLAFSHTPWAMLAAVFLVGAGLGSAGFSTMQATLVFLQSPPEARARMMGLLTVCIGASPLGFLNVGLMAELLGAPGAVAVIAVEGLIAWCLVCAIWPEVLSRGAIVPRPATVAAASRRAGG